jgi:hypothetical protein
MGASAMSVSRAIVLGVLGLGGLAAPARPQDADPPDRTWSKAEKSHWSFVPPKRPTLPNVKGKGWVRNPIDAFILAPIEEVELAPAPEADRRTLIRRITFDLTGLPPSPAEVDAFVNDRRPDAYERLVDRLLGSTAYGERWAQPWLDLARYAESDGFKSDKTRPNAWRYRDWVVKALNSDMPYDRFVALQLAGDEVAPGDPEAFVATGFNRNWPFEDNNMVPGLNRQLILDDVTDTTASVFLGLTVACARCHDHKYDPISQRDYYRLQAVFGASAARDDYSLASPFAQAVYDSAEAEVRARTERAKAAVAEVERPYKNKLLAATMAKLDPELREALATEPIKRSAFQEDLIRSNSKKLTVDPKAMQAAMSPADLKAWKNRTALMASLAKDGPPAPEMASGMADSLARAEPVRLLRKGNFKNPGGEMAPGFPSVLAETVPPPEVTPTRLGTSGRRKALAEWLTRPEHPLTARVIVNRLWQGHFGRGIVATPSDFGTQGREPTHPELLDWLATELVARGWSLKAMHRLMVTSAAYRQSSTPPARTLEIDPENTLLARMPRRRLEAEAVRDALLAVTGTLDHRVGGPSVFPDLPPGVETRGGWTRSASASDRDRRTLYVFVRRNLRYPLLDAFDAPDTNTTCPERNVSVNAPQALMLLNSDLILDEARHFAGRLYREAADRNDRPGLIRSAYRLAFAREPDRDELARGVAFLDSEPALVSGHPSAPPIPRPDGVVPAQAAAMVDYCHALLNLNEFVFVD